MKKEHGLEYVVLDDESELWEIDYDSGHAANVKFLMQTICLLLYSADQKEVADYDY
jgi:hypothetical protein